MRFFFVTLCTYLILVFCFVKGNPTSRRYQDGAIIDNKLYVFGGRRTSNPLILNETADMNELWILNLNQSFDVSTPPWIRGPSTNAPRVAYHTANVGGAENELLIIYGGETPDLISSSSYAVFDTKSQKWSTPNFTNTSELVRRQKHTGVTNFNDSTIIFYGGKRYDNYSSTPQLVDELFLVNMSTDIWSTYNLPVSPDSRELHTSTLLSDGKMYVIGGILNNANNKLAKMDLIPVFDLKTNQWTRVPANGSVIPSERYYHKAVGTWDNKIIIFGGAMNTTSFFNDLYVLDTTTNPYIWTNIITKGVIPSARSAHTMVMAGTNLIITFGKHADELKVDFPNNTLVLDTTSYTWQTTYTPNKLELTTPPKPNIINTTTSYSPIPSSNSSSDSGSSKLALIVGAAASILCAILFSAGLFFFLNWKKQRNLLNNDNNYNDTNHEQIKIEISAPSI
ncbi:2458_t:CDS:2 [Ambispora leptoticha]|uniref:2458_t:CDS:1 n=1 Tax=Ambispora leptoticha TaxID=144679 RepID=A0A9N9B448_9GLOM|nr:2458_t:CDS:2 [Ambispora leptoticha]